ncbi:MAG: hypothetical protein DRJ13_12930, partial [Bacteroidetes bacterium]
NGFNHHFTIMENKLIRMIDNLSVEELEDQISEIKKSIPAHSSKAAQLIELEDLEDELARRLKISKGESDAAA